MSRDTKIKDIKIVFVDRNLYIGSKKVNLFEGIDSYQIDSSPADCVRYAYYGLKLDFDLVFSGINKGFNVGEDIMYSGTCAAIFETESTKRNGIAFSCENSATNAMISSRLLAISILPL